MVEHLSVRILSQVKESKKLLYPSQHSRNQIFTDSFPGRYRLMAYQPLYQDGKTYREVPPSVRYLLAALIPELLSITKQHNLVAHFLGGD